MSYEILPQNWSWVKLGDVCEILDNKRSPINSDERDKRISGKSIESLFPYYGATGQVGYIDDYLLEGEFVLLGEDGAPFLEKHKPKAYIVNGKIWVNNHAHILLSKNHNKFLCYYLNFLDYHPFVTGTTRLKLNQSAMKQIPIVNPPLKEQKIIVEKIEELFSGLDSGVASLKKAKAKIRLYRQSVLASAFSGKLLTPSAERIAHREMLKAAEPKVDYLNQLPDGWKWVKLGEVVESIRYGTSKKCYYEKEGKPVLRIPNIINGYINDEDLKYSEFNKNEIKDLSLIENDILIIRSNGSLSIVGKSAIVSNRHIGFLYAGYLIRIRLVSESYSSKFLNLLLSSNQLRSQIEFKAKSTSGVNNINTKEIQDLIIPFPPLKQQTQIVEEIEKRFSEADNLEKAIDESLAKSETLRQSILKQAFEGKLVL